MELSSKTFAGYGAVKVKEPVAALSYEAPPLKPLEVELELLHAGVCHSDIHFLDTDMISSRFPQILGHEFTGVVVARGSEVSSELPLGTRVGVSATVGSCGDCEDCRNGVEQCCVSPVFAGISRHGGWANGIRVDHRYCFPLPDNLPSEYAAPLFCAGGTVFSPLKRWAKPGDSVMVLGIGGLGHLAIQFSRAMGCKTVAMDIHKDKEPQAKQFGADEFALANDPKVLKAYRRKFNVIVNTVPVNLNWLQFFMMLKTNGKFVQLGLPEKPITVHPQLLNSFQWVIAGSNMASPSDIREMLTLVEKHNIRPQIELFDLAQVNEAVQRVRDGKVRFRAVLRCKL